MQNAYPTEQAREAARQSIYDQGLTVREWAARNELDESTVYAVLNGQKKCLRGKARRVAVLLGIKDGVVKQ
ncbi:TPA: DNA-binding protein [Pseudomonas aeruginosa]|nr:DNA-binding protein [Pseudomonas aeruginosa]